VHEEAIEGGCASDRSRMVETEGLGAEHESAATPEAAGAHQSATACMK